MTQSNSTQGPYRQGDVRIVPVSDIPDSAKFTKVTERGIVLAEGEVTGHAHRIYGPLARHANLFITEDNQKFLKVTAPVALKHEEHKEVVIQPGNYKIIIHHEYAPAALPRQVAD